MSSPVEQVPIRLRLDLISNPPVALVDENTGLAPKLWRAQPIAVAIGIFDSNGLSLDLSNLTYLQVILQKAADSIVPVATVQVNAADIAATITIGAWRAGTAQNALALFTPAQTDQGLDATLSTDYWMIVRGVTANGSPITYGAGAVSMFNPGSSIPPTMSSSLVSRHRQSSSANNITVTPTKQIHTEVIDIAGAARTSNILLGIAGIADGAQLALIVNLPSTPDIVLNVKNALVGNATISTLQTGSVLQALMEYYFDESASAWVPKFYALPPT